NVTILTGATVQSTSDTLQITAGDDIVAQAGSTISSASELRAYVDYDGVDIGAGGIATFNGAAVAPASPTPYGDADNDVLNGTPIFDVLDGGLGVDIMRGGLGIDAYYVDNAGDAVIEKPGEGIDRVYARINFVLPDNVEDLHLLGTANL